MIILSVLFFILTIYVFILDKKLAVTIEAVKDLAEMNNCLQKQIEILDKLSKFK